MKKILKLLIVSVCFITLLIRSPSIFAQTTYGSNYLKGVAIMGDSSSDEYQANDNRGGTYHAGTFSWDELLVNLRNINFGPWGNRSEPRRSGYEYNWARSGLKAQDLIASGEPAGIAQNVRDGKVGYVIVMIGSNDFGWWNSSDGFDAIYNGRLTGSALTQKVQTMAQNVTQSMQTILQAGDVKILYVLLGDMTKSPTTISQYPDQTKQQRIRDAINSYNTQVVAFAQSHGVRTFDTTMFLNQTILANITPDGIFKFGGENILFNSGDEPHHFILGDGIHSGTVGEGLLTNAFLAEINAQLGSTIPLLTTNEILSAARIVSAVKKGDANSDGNVNGQDYVIWLQNYGMTTSSGASKGDFNGDSRVNGQDYTLWLSNYGR